jgi:hypothetical protein
MIALFVGLMAVSMLALTTASEKRYVVMLPKVTPEAALSIDLPPTSTPTIAPTAIATLRGDVAVWQMWELAIAPPTGLEQQPMRLSAQLVGPDGTRILAPGFWDGRVWRVRSFFPQAGIWSWQLVSEPRQAALEQSGQILVDPVATGETNPLYRSGAAMVSAEGRYLVHADGTPFFWLGDTMWDAALQMDLAEWEAYLADRAALGFSVIQLALAPSWSGSQDRQGQPPFIGAIDQPNHAFWEGFEQKVLAANRAGLIILVVGLADPLATNQTDTAAAEAFSRYLVARLHGFHVIFSPTFDHPYRAMAEQVGKTIAQTTDLHLVTQHPGTPSGQATNIHAERYYAQDYLDFAGNQTGHNSGDRSRVLGQARTWNLSLWNRGSKPVINLEAWYDANGTKPDGGGSRQGTAYDARAAGYLSLLSGAQGYSYGAQGLWKLERDPSAPDYWQVAMEYPSAQHMAILRNIFTAYPWWQLVPMHERISSQPVAPEQQAALAFTSDRRFGMAYLPATPTITIDLRGFAPQKTITWIDPTTGIHYPGGRIATADVITITPPTPSDWVILFQS